MDHVLTGGKLELVKLTACFNGVFMQWNSVNMHEIKQSLLPSRKQCDNNEMQGNVVTSISSLQKSKLCFVSIMPLPHWPGSYVRW